MTLSLGKTTMKSPIQLADLPFASDLADFESGHRERLQAKGGLIVAALPGGELRCRPRV